MAIGSYILDCAPTLGGYGSCTDVNNGATAENTFLDTMLADLRGVRNAAPICGMACGQTAVRIRNVHFMAGEISSSNLSVSTYLRTGIRVQRH